MKGHLFKTEKNEWFVRHNDEITPLHEKFPIQPNPFNNYGDGCEVNFILVNEFTHPELYPKTIWGDGTRALLISELKEQELTSDSLLDKIYKLEKEFPNDMDFGKKVRKLINSKKG